MQTQPGQSVVLVGSHPSLGDWSLDGALPMAWTDGHVWKASIELPPDSMDLEYKAVLRSGSGKDVWEKGVNHKAELLGSCDISLYHVFQA
ncbi:carbohydrate-binding-like protein [Scenedesmus sp. NREL 46B-D3]|nr:carbohydrate-binding-like protein [Scenedesmus sp. NREL 46B-D3]